MRTLKCNCLDSWNALWSWRATASVRYWSTLASLGSTVITVKLSLHVGQKGRKRFTVGIAITNTVYQRRALLRSREVEGQRLDPVVPRVRGKVHFAGTPGTDRKGKNNPLP